VARFESLFTSLRTVFGALGIAVVASQASSAQALNNKEPPSVLTGIAIDSINGGFLAGASIVVAGTNLSATTDAGGQFRIEGIPSGPHVIEIHHPLVDSLAIVITTTPKTFRPGDSSFVMVGVPSAETLVRSTCSEADILKGPAFVVGTVMDADTGEPAVGATVTITWADYDIGKKSIKVTPQRREVTVSKLGRFRACGLPDDLVAWVIASRGSDTTAILKTNLASLIGILSFRLPSPRAMRTGGVPASARTITAGIVGRVVDYDGNPAKGVDVAVDADGIKTVTGDDGSFALNGLRPGTRSLTARKIGYEPIRKAIELRQDDKAKISIVLGRSITQLKDMVVSANRGPPSLEKTGFTQRKITANGQFLGPEDLKMRDTHRLESVLRAVPILDRDGGCVRYFVDGFRVATGIDAQDYLGGAEVGAVEVYDKFYVPGEFHAFTDTGVACKAVVVWTKEKIGLR
jgi:hypothetical protein